VQILDPACGTGTFLVEVIDVIHQTMKAKWRKQGHMALEFQNLWNEYVSDHLLPRLYGFELMMAPYAIAHMKIGLKLFETGYSFRSHERARIYLTNSLEPPQDFSDRFEFDAPALAHEAQAVNAIKRNQRFTVVVGNPPYSVSTQNDGEWGSARTSKRDSRENVIFSPFRMIILSSSAWRSFTSSALV
jgi:predicted helicase